MKGAAGRDARSRPEQADGKSGGTGAGASTWSRSPPATHRAQCFWCLPVPLSAGSLPPDRSTVFAPSTEQTVAKSDAVDDCPCASAGQKPCSATASAASQAAR